MPRATPSALHFPLSGTQAQRSRVTAAVLAMSALSADSGVRRKIRLTTYDKKQRNLRKMPAQGSRQCGAECNPESRWPSRAKSAWPSALPIRRPGWYQVDSGHYAHDRGHRSGSVFGRIQCVTFPPGQGVTNREVQREQDRSCTPFKRLFLARSSAW